MLGAAIALVPLALSPGAGAAVKCTGMTTACGGTTYNWQPDASFPTAPAPWFQTAGTVRNWVTEAGAYGIPNSAAGNACVTSDYAPPTYSTAGTAAASPMNIGCLQVLSGTLNLTSNAAKVLNINGPYFRNLNVGSLTTDANTSIVMKGTAAQTFETVDNVNLLTISNAVSVELTQTFAVTTTFTISAGAGIVYVDKTFTLPAAGSAVSIPSGATIEVKSGGELIAPMGLSITGTLKIDAGASVLIGNGKTITINSGGMLQIAGNSGNPGVLDAKGAGTNSYGVTISAGGSVNFNYFTVNRLNATGLSFAGSSNVNLMNNGGFHFLATNGYAVTLPSTSFTTLATTWSSVGFYNDANNTGVRNFNVGTYTGGTITLNSWDGPVGGAANSNPASSTKLSWGAQASPTLMVTNETAANSPPSSIAAASGTSNLFLSAGFSFSNLSGSPTTDITSIKLTLTGINNPADISALNVYIDTNNNCVYDAGVDTAVAAGQVTSFAGSPPTATISLNAGQLTANSTSPKCIFFYMTVASTAQNGHTVGLQIAATTDVVNSNNYGFNSSATPPVTGGQATITSTTAVDYWNGSNCATPAANCAWSSNTANWSTGALPTAATDCQFGSGYAILQTDATGYSCRNLTLPLNGTWDWAAAGWTMNLGGSLTLTSGAYSFTGSASGATLNFNGSGQQGISGGVTWPGSVSIGTSLASNQVVLTGNWTINGGLTVNTGNFVISSGVNLTVGGNVAVNSGGTLTIKPGGTLTFSTNGSTLTVAAGGTLTLVGNSSQSAVITSTSTAVLYSIAVSGTIAAQYYSLSNIGNTTGAVPGLLVNSTATIDATNFLQNGSFSCGASGTAFLKLNMRIPPATTTTSDVLTGMVFNQPGGCAGTPTSIDTSAITPAPPTGTLLTVNSYSGNRSGAGTSTSAANYTVTWGTPTNTIQLTNSANATFTAVTQGATSQIMGRFQFQQTPGGFADTYLSSIKLTLTGTGSASDVQAAKVFYDANCNSTGTTQLGSTMTFTGSPPTATFTGSNLGAGSAAIVPYVTTPLNRCIYVTFDISSTATVGDTLGVEISANGDVSNTQGYAFQGGYAPPVILYDSAGSPNYASVAANGSNLTWKGTTNTAFTTSTNWSPNAVPNATYNCIIPSATNNPTIAAGITATCNSVTITTGNLTIASGGTLNVNGSFTNTGTFTNSGSMVITDAGPAAATNQTISSTSSVSGLTFSKTHGGTVVIGNSALTITGAAAPGLNIPAAQTFTFQLNSGDVLTLPLGMQIASGTFQMNSNSTIAIGSNQAITVAGGTFQIAGANSTYVGSGPSYNPTQAYSNSGTIQPQTAGNRWTFSATSGTVDLTGAILDTIGTNGVNISSGVTLANLNAVQFLNLATANLPALNLNNALGAFTAQNIGFNFGAAVNSYYSIASPAPPAPTSSYSLVTSGATSTGSITFTNWFGDFYQDQNTPINAAPTAGYKYTQNGATITLTTANSPVSLTSFTAAPYKDAVVLNWTTGDEWQHLGFNVYRSSSPMSGYVQINPTLLRNLVTNGSIHGSYEFYDRNIQLGSTYYYKIEDLSTTGTRTLHGPVSATPLASLAAAPPPSAGSYVGTQGLAGPSGTPSTPTNAFGAGQQVLAPGVVLLAQTENSLRLSITVPPFTAVPAEQAPYQRLSIPGYSVTTAAGLPELPQRVIMVAIPQASSATYQIVSQASASQAGYAVAPALAWNPVNGALVSSWTLDTTFYGTNQTLPASPVSLGAVTQSGGQTYLPVLVQPISFNPVTQTIGVTSQVVVDIALNGSALWSAGGAPGASPWSLPGALKIFVQKEGLYQLAYNDLVQAGVNGPFAGADVTKLRLYHRSTELALDVASATGFFGPGDTIRFFAPYTDSWESPVDTLLLVVDQTAGLRATVVNGNPTGYANSRATQSMRSVFVKQPGFGIFNQPFGENVDHIVWRMFYSPITNPGDDQVTATVNLPNLSPNGQVTLTVDLIGRAGVLYGNVMHHLRTWVNGVAYPASDAVIVNNNLSAVTVTLPATAFVSGSNQVTFQAVGDMSRGDYDIMTLQDFTVTYPHLWRAESDVADLSFNWSSQAIFARGFTGSDLVAYDVTDPSALASLSAIQVTLQPQGDYSASFIEPAAASGASERFWVTRASLIPRPLSVELNAGSQLHSVSNAADVLYIGTQEMLAAAAPLAALRVQGGHVVQSVDVEAIYSEFGLGARGGQPIKDFIQYVYTQWSAPKLKYVVLVGGGTYDPKNELGFGSNPDLLPIHLKMGRDWDYAADNWFVAFNAGDDLPSLAIGRIAAATPLQVAAYVNKVIAYETGQSKPPASAGVAIFNDMDQIGGEKFASRADNLGRMIQGLSPSWPVARFNRAASTDAQIRSSILTSFGGYSVIHYLGHGAENEWAGPTVFTNTDADSLQNAQLPVVVTMDCMNGRFFEADPTSPAYQNLAGRLVFNPNGGAIAVWASTSESSPNDQDPYQQALYQNLTRNPAVPLGESARMAKVQVGQTAETTELMNSWSVLGDPMVRVAVPPPPAQASAPQSASPQSSGGGSSDDSHHGGFFSCGTTEGPPSPPSSGGMAAVALTLAAMYLATHRRRRGFTPA